MAGAAAFGSWALFDSYSNVVGSTIVWSETVCTVHASSFFLGEDVRQELPAFTQVYHVTLAANNVTVPNACHDYDTSCDAGGGQPCCNEVVVPDPTDECDEPKDDCDADEQPTDFLGLSRWFGRTDNLADCANCREEVDEAGCSCSAPDLACGCETCAVSAEYCPMSVPERYGEDEQGNTVDRRAGCCVPEFENWAAASLPLGHPDALLPKPALECTITRDGGGGACSFPFSYDGNTYPSCTVDGDSYFWCARGPAHDGDEDPCDLASCTGTVAVPDSAWNKAEPTARLTSWVTRPCWYDSNAPAGRPPAVEMVRVDEAAGWYLFGAIVVALAALAVFVGGCGYLCVLGRVVESRSASGALVRQR